jgi:hypothetical protein
VIGVDVFNPISFWNRAEKGRDHGLFEELKWVGRIPNKGRLVDW